MIEPFDDREDDEKSQGSVNFGGDVNVEEEAKGARLIRAPLKPTREEVELHMATHLPFRSWCPHCIRGKSKGKPHNKSKEKIKEIPTVAVDYMYMRERQEKHEERGMPILVAKDLISDECGTGMIFARVVPKKGVNSYALNCGVDRSSKGRKTGKNCS